MKYPYHVEHNGILYKPFEEIPKNEENSVNEEVPENEEAPKRGRGRPRVE